MDCVWLAWTGLGWAELDCAGRDWAGLGWAVVDCSGLDCTWTGLDWTDLGSGVAWAGLDWTGLGWDWTLDSRWQENKNTNTCFTNPVSENTAFESVVGWPKAAPQK